MKVFRPIRAGCPKSAYDTSGRIRNSPGCRAHRQPILCPRRSAFRQALDLRPMYAYSRASAMNIFPYGTLAEIAREIRSKNISPLELVELHLKRIESLQPMLNAFVHFNPKGARQQARAVESSAARGAQLGPLHGVPLTIKSCIDVAGWPCPAGSPLRKDYVADRDAPLVARLKAAGTILLGNTNTPEFLMAYETDNLLTGKTSNPWNLLHSSGGSSGGEAAAISAGCSAGGVGSDGGGRIRVPPHFCGICGLKPPPRPIPATRPFSPRPRTISWISAVGPLARTIADV